MQAFKQLNSQVIPLDMNHVDTDMIIPAQYLTKVNREGYGEHLFKRLREQDANFVFNDPKYESAEILLTKVNFGCGSSREHAVWALLQSGIRAIIAESYSDIFYNNAAKNGLLTIILEPQKIETLMNIAKQKSLSLHINLRTQRIKAETESFHFDYDPFVKECFLKGQDELDYLLEATQ